MATINATPKIPVTRLSTGDRIRGKLVSLTLQNDGSKAGLSSDGTQSDAEGVRDLARDIFWNLYKPQPEGVDPVPVARRVNQQILDFARQNSYWNETRHSTVSNMLVAMHATGLVHDTVLSDPKLQETLKQQERAAAAQTKADGHSAAANALEQAAEQADEEELKRSLFTQAQRHRTRAEDEEETAQQALAKATQAFGKDDTKTKARIGAALRKAAQEGKELAESAAGWGNGPGGEVRNDPRAAQDYLNRVKNNQKLAQIARLAGRFKGIAMSARSSRVAVGNIPYDATYTRDLTKVFASELALLADERLFLSPEASEKAPRHAPGILRAKQAANYADRGLLGVDTRGEALEAGPFVYIVDTSGSMGGMREIIAKAVGLGLAQVAQNEMRRYILGLFGSDHDYLVTDQHGKGSPDPTSRCASEQGWIDHLNWAARSRGGGTSFDRALRDIMDMLLQLPEDERHNADAVIGSDGEGLVSKAVAEQWRAFKEEYGTRLLYLNVDQSPMTGDGVHHFGLPDLADKTIQVDDLDQQTGDRLAADIGTWIQ